MNDAAALAVQIERPVIATEDRRSFDGYLARLAKGHGPGLVIFSEMWGVAPSKTEMAEDYARRGWCAYAPNMFWRSEFTGVMPFEEADQAWRRLNAFDWQRAADDARVAVQWLRTQAFSSGKVAAIGFCMGGRTAFLAAAHGDVDASISLYALGIAKHLDELRTITTPLQLHYGLNDEHIPKSEVDAVIAAAKDNRNVEVYLYPDAEHGFFTKGPAGVQRRGGSSCHRTYRAVTLKVDLAGRQPKEKIYSLSGLPSTAAGIFWVCLLHAHILPARMSACCWNITTSTPILRSPCRRSRCASLVGHN
jgi:carboxymethylenebutenolidase